jgi:hypothetical protein
MQALKRTDVAIQLVDAYIKQIEDEYRGHEDEAGSLVLVLKIYKMSLRQKHKREVISPDMLATYKHGVRQAELLLNNLTENEPELMVGWYIGIEAQNAAQRLANILWELVLELTQQIMATEAMFPELKPAFDRERRQYRKMLEEAREAEAL